ncbi:MAG: DUF3043 domain-containing protein [Nocardioidaceae bacterium]|nr:DUF3043 domain-containing protein [Nocardioidaceae bacterium]
MRSALFRRTDKSEPAAEAIAKEGGKGRPTPTRKEAQAASKERARAGMDKKGAQKLLRERRAENNKKMREGMKSGDERYLPPRDQGPVKRFIRNWVDSRITFTEFLLPILIVIMVLMSVGKPGSSTQSVASLLWSASILLLLVDIVYTRFRLRRALRARFPGEDLKGTTFYAFIRILQIRPLRMPKTQVKIGQKLD